MIQIPKSDVNSWEAGKSVPPGAIIAKMEKVLGVKLPRPPKNWSSFREKNYFWTKILFDAKKLK